MKIKRRTIHVITALQIRVPYNPAPPVESYGIAKITYVYPEALEDYGYLSYSYLQQDGKRYGRSRYGSFRFSNKENATRFFRKNHPKAKLVIFRQDQSENSLNRTNYIKKIFNINKEK